MIYGISYKKYNIIAYKIKYILTISQLDYTDNK